MNSFEELMEANKDIITAYKSMNESVASDSYMHPDVKHNIVKDSSVVAHHFEPTEENLERVHGHLVSQGFKQNGASSVSGPSVETRYAHPETKKVVYVGHNKHSGWLDAQE